MLRKGKETDSNDICELMNALEEAQFDRKQLQQIFQQQLHNEQYYALCYEEDGKVKGILNL